MDTYRDLLSQFLRVVETGENAAAQDLFNQAMAVNLADTLEAERDEMAQVLFKTPEEVTA